MGEQPPKVNSLAEEVTGAEIRLQMFLCEAEKLS